MLPETSLDLSWVTPQLAVGGSYPASAAEQLARVLGIGCVVDLRVERCDDERALQAHGIELLHLPTRDACAMSLPMLDRGVAWVDEKLDRGLKVYIHCEHGVGRSALLTLCVLVARGDSPLRALARAKAARSQVSPSPEQLEAYRDWLAARRREGGALEVPSFDELAWIAYSHWRELAESAEGGAQRRDHDAQEGAPRRSERSASKAR
jgi:protein-tyrosine phosphatase